MGITLRGVSRKTIHRSIKNESNSDNIHSPRPVSPLFSKVPSMSKGTLIKYLFELKMNFPNTI
jgi:hypothetical protein